MGSKNKCLYAKPLAIFCICILFAFQLASASPEGPITSYFQEADEIYLVRVTAIEQNKATLSVVETLKGAPAAALSLKVEFPDIFKKDSEHLILSTDSWRKGYRGNMVGSFFNGDIGWLFAPVTQVGNKAYLNIGTGEKNGLSMEQVKQLLKQPTENSGTAKPN